MVTCTECGEQNPVGTEFCLYCHAFLAWDEAASAPPRVAPKPSTNPPTRTPTAGHPLAEAAVETRMMPRIQPTDDSYTVLGPQSDPAGPTTPVVPDDAGADHDLFRLTADQTGVTVPPSGEPAGFAVRITNTSGIVDGYALETPGAPGWLAAEASQLSLLPGAEDTLTVRLRVVSPTLVPAQQVRVLLRITSLSQSPAHTDLPVTVTVPVVDAPVRLRAEPRLLKIRDTDIAEFAVLVDNSSSNRTARLVFSGSDPELAVQFRFDPPTLEVAPGGTGSAKVAARVAGPEAGQEVSRALTVAAVDGPRSVETLITLQQATSIEVVDPMVGLEVVPSVVRVRDRAEAVARVVVDNTNGREWAHVRMEASDPERVVRVSWEQPLLHVPPGRTSQTEVRFEARLPEAGTEASRIVTVAANDGRRRATTTATFVQAASDSPMKTLALRLEPSALKVQDADGANGQVVIDNHLGASGIRVSLQGRDPEASMRFSFQQPVVDVGPGQTVAVGLRLDAWRPPPGEQVTRQFSIAASDGQTAVEASGSLLQTSSRNPIETLSVKLDPSVLQLGSGRRGQLMAVLDNRSGTQPVRVRLRGDDPMNIVRFAFAPGELDVPPGAVTTAVVTVEAPRAPNGQELTRPITVIASDGRAETPPAEASMVQSSPVRVSYARQIWRVILTLLGGLIMILGALFLPFRDDDESTFGFDASEVSQTFRGPPIEIQAPNGDLFVLPAVGWVIAALAVLMMFGLTGPKGKLTRLAAAAAAVLIVGLTIALGFFGVGVFLSTVVIIVLGLRHRLRRRTAGQTLSAG